MPRHAKGARLYKRGTTFYVRDGQTFFSTGTRDRRGAETALARYITEKDRPTGPLNPDQMTVGKALEIYATERAPLLKAPDRIGYAISAIFPILGNLPVGSINGQVCRRYGETRSRAPGTIRKELGVLQAAINFAFAEGYLTETRNVRLPEKPPARDRWLTRDEAAKLLRAAWRNPKSKHLARFILIALYTGTRSAAILRLGFMPNTFGGYVDTESGMMYRRTPGKAETKKRQPPIPIPRPLLAHLRRWKQNGSMWVVEIDNQRVASVKTAWKTALEETGIAHCTRHDLRHTAITWAMQRGMERWDASGFFGVTMDVLERTYAHHSPDYLRDAAKIMERRK